MNTSERSQLLLGRLHISVTSFNLSKSKLKINKLKLIHQDNKENGREGYRHVVWLSEILYCIMTPSETYHAETTPFI